MKKRSSIFTILLLSSLISYGQFQIDWQQSYGSMAPDIAYDIVQTAGGYLVVGVAHSGGGQVSCTVDAAMWLIKIDNSGNLLWQKCFEHSATYRMVKAIGSPHYYLIGGTNSEPYPDDYNLWVAKIDSLGNIIWERTLGNTTGILGGDQYGEPTADGGVIATAQIDSKGGDITNWHGGYDGWVIKLDSLGNTQWDQSIESSQFEFINGIIQTSDCGYLAGLYGKPNGIGGNVDCVVYPAPGGPNAIVFKMDADGNPEWHQCYGGSGHEGVTRLLELEDGYLISGWGGSNDGDLVGAGWHGGMDVWLVKIDYNGNIIWQKCYGGSGGESPKRIFLSADGGIVVFAGTDSFDGDVVGNPSSGPGTTSIWIFKVNSAGELLWQQCIGGGATERVYGVVKHNDNKYAVAGEMEYSPSGDVNCSNFVHGSQQNYWVFGISDTTVNIEEASEQIIKVYPNPAQDYVVFEIPPTFLPTGAKNNTTLRIHNILGQEVAQIPLIAETTVWETSGVKSGLYFYHFGVDGMVKFGKILISK